MDIDRYQIENNINSVYFEFISKGNHGSIVKLVKYDLVCDDPLVFNLGFGDKNAKGEIDFSAISDNGDTEKVLSTVAYTLFDFFDVHPTAIVYFVGLTKTRTRLYQMGISKFISLIPKEFSIYGELDGVAHRFQKGVNYNSFIIRKSIK
jgi:hypothetical protein